MPDFTLLPEQASTFAEKMDPLFYAMVLISLFFIVLVFTLVIFFAVRYRRGSRASRKGATSHNTKLEVVWTAIPLVLGLIVFFWSARLFGYVRTVPEDAIAIFVIGKQWMWHMQHPNGVRENNELHVPAGRPIKLVMISQDVIHDLYVPAFRIHQDVLPGKYTYAWFEATKTGKYRIYCGQYCGTQHSEMTGFVYVMEPAEYQAWLASGGDSTRMTQLTMDEAGQQIYDRLQCGSCHGFAPARAPSLIDLYGSQVKLADGRSVRADETYLRESIVAPDTKIVEGYQAIMPSYRNQLSEDQLLQLIAFIKSLRSGMQAPAPKEAGSPAGGAK